MSTKAISFEQATTAAGCTGHIPVPHPWRTEHQRLRRWGTARHNGRRVTAQRASPVDPRQARLAPLQRLTPRQREVLALVAAGHSNASIAKLLVISEKAVVQHTSQIYDRLDIFADDSVHRRVQAVLAYLGEPFRSQLTTRLTTRTPS